MATGRQGRIIFAALAVGALFACRASNPRDPESDLQSVDTKEWYGADGSKTVGCAPPAATCTNFQDDKDFVDKCVDSHFAARTCGCQLRCDGKIDYVAAPATPEKTAAGDAPGCSDAAKAEIDAIYKRTTPGGSLYRCIETHVCGGVLGSCDGSDRNASSRLRALARSGCEAEVVGPACKGAALATFACPEPNIDLLSTTWAEFRSKDVAVKRCMQKVVCSDDKSGCSAGDLKQAQAIKAAMDREGCAYWLKKFCALGGESW